MTTPATPHEAAQQYRRGAWNIAATYGTRTGNMQRAIARQLQMADWLDELEERRAADTQTWDDLPTTDQGDGLCEWCGRAITRSWPAVTFPEGDDTTHHFHACPYVEDGFPHGTPPEVAA